jgi:carbon storage regulator
MLVLSRKKNQRIMIGDDIEIVVVAIQGDRVKFGFNAPDDVQIHREEVYQRIQSEKVIALNDAAGNALSDIARATS